MTGFRNFVILAALASTARAETRTLDIHDIRTHVGASDPRVGVAIDTHADRVVYEDPVIVDIPGVGDVYELHGSVLGRGWGGIGIIPTVRNHHYDYEIQFVARWRVHGHGHSLLTYHHGGSTLLVPAAKGDFPNPAANVNRFAELLADEQNGIPALLDHMAYVSANGRGLLPDGRFAAKFDPDEVPTLNQLEVTNVLGQIGNKYSSPDLAVGLPMPTTVYGDSATFRDVDRAIERVVSQVSGIRFRTKILGGVSAGSLTAGGIAFGCTNQPIGCIRTGGNRVVPYDKTSPRIFDGFILAGYALYTPAEADADEPLGAPTMFVQGRADERYQYPVAQAAAVLRNQVALAGSVWIYEYANLVHVSRDSKLSPIPEGAREGEPIGPYFGAALRNLRELLENGTPPPPSRMAGRIENGLVRFDVAGGTTIDMPIREDLILDSVDSSPASMIVTQTINAAKTEDWSKVTGALPHINHEIVGPSIACRIGSYKVRFFGDQLTPFSPEELESRFGSFRGYQRCVTQNLRGLEAERLYDPRVENAHEVADRACGFFNDCPR